MKRKDLPLCTSSSELIGELFCEIPTGGYLDSLEVLSSQSAIELKLDAADTTLLN